MTTNIQSQVNEELKTSASQAIIDATGLDNTNANNIAGKVSQEISNELVQSVNRSTNQTINDVKNNLIGTSNPVDIVAGNFSSSELTNTLKTEIQNQLVDDITSKFANKLQGELINALPTDKASILNIEALAGSLSSSVKSSIVSSLFSAISGLFKPKKVKDAVETSAAEAAEQDRDNLVETATQNYSDQTVNNELSKSETYNTDNVENTNIVSTTSLGFVDPTGTYPTKEYQGLTDVNKLAVGDIRGTIVQKKNLNRMQGAKLPGEESWSQPLSPFVGEYPFNKVIQTERGHIIEMDDTPGSERLHIYHRSGTFVEIDASGSVTKRTTGSSYEIIDRNGKIAISGKADISVNGGCNIYVGTDANIEVEGNTSITCHNDISAAAGGKFNLSAAEEFNISSSNVNIEANVALNLYSNKDLNMLADENLNIKSFYMYTYSVYNYIRTVLDLHEQIGNDRYGNTAGNFYFTAAQTFNIDSPLINENVGTSIKPQGPIAATAGRSKFGVLDGRKDIDPVEIDDPVVPTIADPYALRLEEDLAAEGEYDNHKSLIVLSGLSSIVDFERQPKVIETASIQSQQSKLITASESLLSKNPLPGNFFLSSSFTVDMLSAKASLVRSRIPQSENSGQIYYNLQQVALNILEPAASLFPSLIIASGYRSKDISSINSEHPFGSCVDIQFLGYKPSDYFNIAKRLARVLNYDQLILEYTSYSNTPWIHISYKGENNRKQVMTFWNNRKHSDGLSKLA